MLYSINMSQIQLKASECLGINLKALRESVGLSLNELGDAVGLSKQSIWNYENEARLPSPDALAALAKYFKLEETDFFDPKLSAYLKRKD